MGADRITPALVAWRDAVYDAVARPGVDRDMALERATRALVREVDALHPTAAAVRIAERGAWRVRARQKAAAATDTSLEQRGGACSAGHAACRDARTDAPPRSANEREEAMPALGNTTTGMQGQTREPVSERSDSGPRTTAHAAPAAAAPRPRRVRSARPRALVDESLEDQATAYRLGTVAALNKRGPRACPYGRAQGELRRSWLEGLRGRA